MENEITIMLRMEKLWRPLGLGAKARVLEYFRSALAEEQGGTLTRVGGLTVGPHETIIPLSGVDVTLPKVG